MTVTIEMTAEEAAEYLRFKSFKTREEEEIAQLATRLENLATNVYKAIELSEENGAAKIVNESYARAALILAGKVLL